MSKLYISDLHLFHKNVTKAGRDFDGRPYKDLDEMHEDILKRWNSKATNADHVYVIGDMVWKINSENRDEVMSLLKSMNGCIHLIQGNHDKIHTPVFRTRFEEIVPYKRIEDVEHGNNRDVILSHYYMPFYDKHRYGSILLHGHSHDTEESEMEVKITNYLNENGFLVNAYNVGCMKPYMDYTPRTLEEIIDRYEEHTNGKNRKRVS